MVFLRTIQIFSFCLFAFCGAEAFAAAPAPVPEAAPVADPLKETVRLAAQVDAYNVFCKGEDGLGAGVITRYGEAESAERKAGLENVRAKSFEAMTARLTEKKMECGSGDYLMEKLTVMQQLKIVFAQILGVDPHTQKLDGSPLPAPPAELGAPAPGQGISPPAAPVE
ncbi:MAG: hypothetical protein KJ017_05070 [Alphaproteobacteria bacterium]|nr:hypothetical protein [Alphaproteobacteria bacterium]